MKERNVKNKSLVKSQNEKWSLRLYVAGQIKRGATALNNLKVICEGKLKDNYEIEVIDLLKNPALARDHQIIAIPTLVGKSPLPVRNIIGDLSNAESVMAGLDLK
jgi:circadian clock protein KaiB